VLNELYQELRKIDLLATKKQAMISPLSGIKLYENGPKLWRDYFKFLGLKYGNQIFWKKGIHN